MLGLPDLVRRCRDCGQTPPAVRFRHLSSRCAKCQDARKAMHTARAIAKPPSPPPVRMRSRTRECSSHLAWVRTLPCAVDCSRCGTIRQAHHVRLGTGGGMGIKPSDRWSVPLCPAHHAELHRIGQRSFDARYGLNLRDLAMTLARLSPYLPTEKA